jgi:hypothetical protein
MLGFDSDDRGGEPPNYRFSENVGYSGISAFEDESALSDLSEAPRATVQVPLSSESAMNFLLGLVTLIGSAAEQALGYLERHHWFFGAIAVGYIFHLHDKALHARLDALDRRLDEIRKRLASGD